MEKEIEMAKGRSGAKQVDMLNGPLLKKIILFAIPVALSSILQQLFNSADVAVVGRFAGSKAMAAVGGNSSVISLLINLFVGLSMGANVVIAQYIGQQDTKKVKDVVHTVMMIAIISGVFLLFAGQFIARPILELMNSPKEVIDLATLYLKIYFLGMPFIMIYNFGAAILRSVGDTKRPMYGLIASGVVNVVLNLVLVLVFHLGVAGVGIATVIADIVSAGIILWLLMKEKSMIRLELSALGLNKTYVKQVIRIGAPAGIQGMVFSLSNVCIQSGINSFGAAAIAGSAAAINFEFFAYYVNNAFCQAAVTFTSQNFGAGKFDRCKKIFRMSMICGIIGVALMSGCFVIGRTWFIRFYSTEPEVMAYGLVRMIHVTLFAAIPVLYEVGGATLRGMGYSMLPTILTMIGSCGFRFVWLYTVFKKYHDFGMLMNVYPVSWVITSILVIGAYYWIRRKLFVKQV